MDHSYSIHEAVVARDALRHVVTGLEGAALARTRAGARHVLAVPAVRALANEAALLEIARAYVGPSAFPFRATLFDKSASGNWLVPWHQDTALPLRRRFDAGEWGPWSTKGGVVYAHAPAWALEQIVALRVSVDDCTTRNGPLRVLPDSHRRGVLRDDEIARLVRQSMPVECIAASGSIVAMRPLTVHASSKSTDDSSRRVLHIEYAAAVRFGAGAELAVG